jgi:hypothetical protein
MTKPITAALALKLLVKAEMRPFDRHNWDAYAGCETQDPMFGTLVGEPEIGDVEVVLDGDNLLIVTEANMDEGGAMFNLKGGH